ncbi:hypothetical protein ACOME3_002283 [Neoechinorhynchus agilis]
MGRPSCLSNLIMAIECIYCFTRYCRATYAASALELKRWSEGIGPDITLWKDSVVTEVISWSLFKDRLSVSNYKPLSQGTRCVDWVEREADVSPRFIPPKTRYGARARDLFPGCPCFVRCVDLVAHSGYCQVLTWLLDSLSSFHYFEDCIGWLKWVSSVAKANARSCPEMGMLVDVHRWFGHFPFEDREGALRSTRGWLGRLNAPALCSRPDMWERICYVEAVAYLEATFPSTNVDEALVLRDYFSLQQHYLQLLASFLTITSMRCSVPELQSRAWTRMKEEFGEGPVAPRQSYNGHNNAQIRRAPNALIAHKPTTRRINAPTKAATNDMPIVAESTLLSTDGVHTSRSTGRGSKSVRRNMQARFSEAIATIERKICTLLNNIFKLPDLLASCAPIQKIQKTCSFNKKPRPAKEDMRHENQEA